MEIGEINNVANRKRINVEVEKLREKVSRETAKIIKLKVAQDTAYWDLKEKLQQVEGNHERLQQNMVEVQMQHETMSGQYQDELRLRPDTLNKLTSTREICEVLEDYGERLKETLSRCKADQAALCAAYRESGRRVRDLTQRQLQADERHRLLVDSLQDKVKVGSEHHNQLLQLFSATRQQAEADVGELKNKLDQALHLKDNLVNNVNELNRKLELCTFDVEKKEQTISNLQRDMKQLLQDFNSQSSDAKNTLMKQEKDLKEALEANSSLKAALNNQEQFTKSVCEQNNILQEKVAALEDEKSSSTAIIHDLENKLQDAININEGLNNDVRSLREDRERLLTDTNDKEQLLRSYKEDVEKLNEQISGMDEEKNEITSNLNKVVEELNEKHRNIEELTATIQHLNQKIAENENTYKEHCELSEEQLKELRARVEALDRELDAKATAITQLMSELKLSTDIRSKLETTLQKAKKEIDIERDNVKERERKMNERINKLETDVKDKEDELSKQMSIILEMRNEKDRLQEKIQGMQNTIDNIQKELTGRRAPPPPADHDDNAVLTPARKNFEPASPSIQKPVEFAVPRKEPKLDSMLYNIFSDSSMEGDTLDVSEVNRRFAALARGERVSPAPLAALKRRAGVAAPARAPRPQQECDGSISLSQVKNDMKMKERSFFKNKKRNK
ncbi:unnamed protein product, partial [Brenthis ino]